jgi:hypothetical protein
VRRAKSIAPFEGPWRVSGCEQAADEAGGETFYLVGRLVEMKKERMAAAPE